MNTDIMQKQHRKMTGAFPITVTYDGDNYQAGKTTVNLEHLYMDAGRLEQYSFSVILTQDDFSTLPAVDEKLTIGAVTYRILGRQTDAADISVRLDVGPEYDTG